MIKSNLIPTKWATHKLENNCITEVLPQEWELSPSSESPDWECSTRKRNPQSIQRWRPLRLDCRSFTGLRKNRDFILKGYTQNLMCTRTNRESSNLIDAKARHHPYSRKWRGTKKPLDESERGGWKSWLKAQHSEN